MQTTVKDFSGNLIRDVSKFRLRPQDYTDALNITHNSEGDATDGPLGNIKGNRVAAYDEPAGVNLCIGAHADRLRDRIISFHWNSNGYHSIRKFTRTTRVVSKIFESRTDSGDIDILNLQPLYKVKDIDVIHRDEEGDLLFFNDGYNRPGGFNISTMEAGTYTPVPEEAIRVAKKPPLNALSPVYDTDATVAVNNLKGKLFQFIYRWVYEDGYASSWSPISKVKLPLNAYEVDVESDPTKNNVIYLQVTGGPVDYKKIQIAVRESAGVVYGDFHLVDTLDRTDYNISDGDTYTYKFLNDGAYPPVSVQETDLLFDYVPDKANAQAMVNGNVLAYAGITDGYDQIARADINVQLTSALVDTVSSGVTPANPEITYVLSNPGFRTLDFFIGASVGDSSIYNIKFKIPLGGSDDIFVDVSYTATALDTQSTVAAAFQASIAAQVTDATYHVTYIAPNQIRVRRSIPLGYAYADIVVNATPLVLKAGGSPTWKWNAKYRFGLLYFDKYGKTNGVISFVSNNEDPNDFSVTTPDFNVSFTPGDTDKQPRIPVIYAAISHRPPPWAVSYQWVRTPNLSVSYFLQYITAQVDSDASYFYLGIANLDTFRLENTGFVPSYDFAKGDRVRIMGAVLDGDPREYVSQFYSEDYEILGTVDRPVGAADPVVNGRYIKIAKAPGVPAYEQQLLIEIYRPALRTGDSGQVFYEFGESYGIYTDPTDGLTYHIGENQNQNASQPATFTFEDGDVYYKFRNFYTDTLNLENIYQVGIMDANYSDFFASAVNSNGRPNVIDPNAKLLYNPTLIRFGNAYLPGTDINGLNRFYPDNFDEYIRDYGDVMRMISWNNGLIVFQKLKIGRVPVLEQIWTDVAGNENVAVSQQLLNRIKYFSGEYGCGDVPDAIAWDNAAIWGWDSIRGVGWRLSQNGLEPISIQNGFNNFAVTELRDRGFTYKVYGVFDTCNNLYISAFEATADSPAQTLVWNEVRNGYESFLSYLPEMMCSLNNVLATWKNGSIFTHDADTYNQFYGVDYPSSVKVVFNEGGIVKKTWTSCTQQGSSIWAAPQISTSVLSYPGVYQQSNLIESDFETLEDFSYAAFKRDTNSVNGLVGGDVLKGAVMEVNFEKATATQQEFLNMVSASFIESPLNNK